MNITQTDDIYHANSRSYCV